MIRAVLDTNILVSALIRRDGKPSQIVSRAVLEFVWLTSDYILAETVDVLTRKHIQARYGKWLTPVVQARFIETARAVVEIVDVQTTLAAVPKDVKDNPVLACALDGQAEYLVTGDPHLLTLKTFQSIHIVSPNQFLQILDEGLE
jgi:uncharacterized protein